MAEHVKPTPVIVVGTAAGVLAGVLLTGVVVVTGWPDGGDEGEVLVASARNPSALVALEDGGLRYGERLSGNIRDVSADGDLDADVSTGEIGTTGTDGDQRGLLGLVVDGEGRTFASFTRGGRLLVAEVGDEERVVWEGVEAADEANGGRLVMTPDGDLLLGIGDLGQPELADDPDELNGKVVVLDPEGGEAQEPTVVGAGLANPRGLAYVGDAVWVADDAPEDGADRLGTLVAGTLSSVVELDEPGTPSGLVVLDGSRLGVCGYGSGELAVFDLGSGRPVLVEEAGADGCLLDAVVLADGEVAVAEADTIRVVAHPE